MKQLSILCVLFTLGVAASYAETSQDVTNVKWGMFKSHECSRSKAQSKLQRYQEYRMSCEHGNMWACQKQRKFEMKGNLQKYQQWMNSCPNY